MRKSKFDLLIFIGLVGLVCIMLADIVRGAQTVPASVAPRLAALLNSSSGEGRAASGYAKQTCGSAKLGFVLCEPTTGFNGPEAL